MNDSKLVQITKDQDGRELIMVRVDKTLKEMMGKDDFSGRWDPDYYHPALDAYIEIFNKLSIVTKPLGRLGNFYITTGSGSKRIYTHNGGVKYIQNINVRNTGIDFSIRVIEIKRDSEIDRKATRVNVADVIFNRSGVGTLGRTVFIGTDLGPTNISNDVYIIRNTEVSQAYLALYLMCEFGQAFIEAESHGVSGLTKINTDDIKKIPIPILPREAQKNIEVEYKKMSVYHDKAMEAKKKGDNTSYKENLEIAEEMLKDLVSKTEGVIRGERKDIV